jgi:IS605 OrfB family transposase
MSDRVKQIAARVVRECIEKGRGTIVLDDWSSRDLADGMQRRGEDRGAAIVRNWPFAMQREAIKAAASKAGIALVVVPSENESATCPKCGNVDAKQDGGRGVFECLVASCGVRRGVESVAAWNMLAAAGFRGSFVRNAAKWEMFGERARGVRNAGVARKSDSATLAADETAAVVGDVVVARGARKVSGKPAKGKAVGATGAMT